MSEVQDIKIYWLKPVRISLQKFHNLHVYDYLEWSGIVCMHAVILVQMHDLFLKNCIFSHQYCNYGIQVL